MIIKEEADANQTRTEPIYARNNLQRFRKGVTITTLSVLIRLRRQAYADGWTLVRLLLRDLTLFTGNLFFSFV